MRHVGFVLHTFILLTLVCFCACTAQAEPAETSPSASSVASKQVTFKIFDEPSGGYPLWEESQIAVPDGQGLYRVLMGAGHSEGVPVQFATGAEARWLGVQVEGEEEQPRILLASLKPVAMGTAGVKSSSSGPVLYQILFRNNARPGFLPKISPTFSLTNSLISDDGSNIHIGGLSIASDGTITFTATQSFPGNVNSIASGNGITITGSATNPIISLNTSSNITGTISADFFRGDGRFLTNVPVSVTAGNGITITGSATNPTISLNTSSNIAGTLSMDFFRGDGRFLTNVNAITANFAANAGSLNGLSGSTFARNDVPNDIVSGSIPPGHSGALNGLQVVNNGNLTLNNGNLSVAGTGSLTGNLTVGSAPNTVVLNATNGGVNAAGPGAFGSLLTESGGSLLPALGTATTSNGFNSNASDYTSSVFNSTAGAAQNQTFRWQAEPVGNNTATPSATLNLLFGANGAPPAEANLKFGSDGTLNIGPGPAGSATGMKINGVNGTITFSANQVFPGSVTSITSGNDVSMGGVTKSIFVDNTNPSQPIVEFNTANADLRYDTLGTAQTINGAKTFTSTLAANGGLTGTTGTFSGTLAANGGLTGTTASFTSTGNFAGDLTVGASGSPKVTLSAASGNGVLAGNLSVGGTTALTGALGGSTAAFSGNVTVGTAGNTITANASNGNVTANSFTGDGSTLTNVNATLLGGIAAANYARLDIGNSFNGNQAITGNVTASANGSFGGTLSVTGAGSVNGLLTAAGGSLNPAKGTATSGGGFTSNSADLTASVFNSTASTAQNQMFRWQAEPVGNNTPSPSATLNLLFGANGAAPAEANFKLGSDGTLNIGAGAAGSATGMKINGPDGVITFNSNQVFPGSVTSVTAGDASITVDNSTPSTPKISVSNLGIITAKLADQSVTTNKIADANVTNGKLQNSSVTINTAGGLTGGGILALGGTLNLGVNNAVIATLAGNNAFTGNNSFSQSVAANGGLVSTTGTFSGNVSVTGTTTLTGALSGSTGAFSGNVTANSFTGDGSTLTNVNATQLGGVAAANYARLDVGNSFTGNQSVTGNVTASGNGSFGGTFAVTGASTLTGALTANGGLSSTTGAFSGLLTEAGGALLPAKGTATSGGGFNSNLSDFTASAFNSTAAAAQNQTFRWQAEPLNNNTPNPSATLNLLFGANGAAPAEANLKLGSDGTLNVGAGAAGSATGMKINGPDGLITFNSTQVFPGSVTSVTAGDSSITIGGSASAPTVAVAANGITTAKIADANVTNAKLVNSSVTISNAGGLTVSGSPLSLGGTLSLGIDNTVVATLAGTNAFTGNNSFSQSLAANGGLSSTNGTFSGTLGVTGATTLTGSLTGSTGTFSGNVTANTFTGDGSALTNVNATKLGGVNAANYARLDIANTFASNQSIGGTLNVTGASTLTGALTANGGITSTTGSFTGAVATGPLTVSGGETVSSGNLAVSAGNVNVTGNVTVTGNVNATNMNPTGAITTQIANEGTTGTTQFKLAKLTGAPSTAILATTSDSSGLVGIVVSASGTTGNATIMQIGQGSCVFDGPTTAGDYVVASNATGGDCHDAGANYPTLLGSASSVQVMGRVLTTNAAVGGGTYSVVLFGPEQRQIAVMGTTGTQVANAHIVTGSATTSGGSATVNFSNAAIFSSATSFSCTANDSTAPTGVQIVYTSGSSITLNTVGLADTVRFQCTGN